MRQLVLDPCLPIVGTGFAAFQIDGRAGCGLKTQTAIGSPADAGSATAKSDYENSLVTLENAKDDFKLLIGMSLYEDFIVLPNIAVDTVSVNISFAIDQGLKNRMELRQRNIDIENSQFDLIQTKAVNEFKGNLSLSVGLSGYNEKFRKTYADPNRTDNEGIALSFAVPLWDWGRRKSMIKASEAGIACSKIDLEVEQNNIIIDIRKVYRNLLNLENQIEIARAKCHKCSIDI